jgi:DNA-binding protein HU-beta
VNRSELVAAVAAQVGSEQAEARRHVDAVFETIMNSVGQGDRVVVTGFGTFERVTRPARTARHPRTGQPIQVASTQAPRFSVGRTFKENVSGTPAGPATVSAKPAANASTGASAEVSGDAAGSVPDVAVDAAPDTASDAAPDGKKKKKKKKVVAAGPNRAKQAKAAKPGKGSAKRAARKGK